MDDAREVLVRCCRGGRVGEGSREWRGEGAAEEEVDVVEVCEVCEVNFEGHESVFGVMVAVLEVDSRDNVGWSRAVGILPVDCERSASAEPVGLLDDGSMSAAACVGAS